MQIEKTEIQKLPDFTIEHFPDRSARWLFQYKQNVQGLLEIVANELVEFIDFSRLVPLNRRFISDTLREQESDIVFSVPFRRGSKTEELLIYILIEHQSTVDATMGVRVLSYMTELWAVQRRVWESDNVPRNERRLHLILPIVFYTGEQRWNTPLTLAGIMDIPEELSRFVPTFDTLFLNVKETDEATLTQTDHSFGWLLTVLQKENADKAAMQRALERAISHLNTLDTLEAEQRQQALIYFLLLILHRRPVEEHEELIIVVDRHTDEMEVETMAQSIIERSRAEGIEQGKAEGIEQGKAEGIEQGKAEGIEQERRESAIRHILVVLNTRFSSDIANVLTPAIQNINAVERLEELLPAAVEARSPEAFAQILHEDGS